MTDDWDAGTYLDIVRAEVPDYDDVQAALVAATEEVVLVADRQ